LKFVEWDTEQMDEESFIDQCRKFGVKEVNHPAAVNSSPEQAIIGEPI
jgi:hypothetical protein